MKKILFEITIDDEGVLSWHYSPDLSRFNMYALYGLFDLLRQELADDFRGEFEPEGDD